MNGSTSDPLRSAVLNLELRQEDGMLRLYDPQTGERLPTSDEEAQARERQRRRVWRQRRRVWRRNGS
jgi:hypothetical protein